MSIKSDFVDRSGQTREQHSINFYSLSDMFTYFFFFFATFSSQMIFFFPVKNRHVHVFPSKLQEQKRRWRCCLPNSNCGLFSWWRKELLDHAGLSCASGRASEHVSEVEIDAFQRAGNACVCSPNTNVNEWKQINSDKWDN